MTIQQPPLPAVPNYPTTCPWEGEIEQAHERFVRELNTDEGWQDMGEKEGVRLARKHDESDANPIPLSRGECFVEDVTPEAFLAGVVQLPGMRALWDPRTEVGFMMERFERNTVLFYALTKGKKFLAQPRDMVGIQRNYADEDGTRTIIQTSVNAPSIPEQKKTTRATLKLSGWSFRPEGNGVRVIYILDVALNGKLPNTIVSMATSESPLCAGRARDVYYEYGHAPFVDLPLAGPDPSIVFQLETISIAEKDYRCTVTTASQTGETFDIVYDTKRMYPRGVRVRVEGEGVEAQDDGKGTVKVTTNATGQTGTVVIVPQ